MAIDYKDFVGMRPGSRDDFLDQALLVLRGNDDRHPCIRTERRPRHHAARGAADLRSSCRDGHS